MPPSRRPRLGLALAVGLLLAAPASFRAETPLRYRFSFPEPAHHWMQVDAAFTDLDPAPLALRMSRASPGRYSLHDFAKNVYDVHVRGADGAELATTRPDPYGWTVPVHGAALTVSYKVFGDTLDGTYLAIDLTHAHLNMPAVFMWAQGLDDRPVQITLSQPGALSTWSVATQLHPGATPLDFSAPNLQYLMDSPIEFGPLATRRFTVGERTFRFAAHHTGTDAELDGLVADVEKIVREEWAVYGEFPVYEPGVYTFLADYLPYADEDGMEHRNSTVMTTTSSIRDGRPVLLDIVAHEFFHGWNVERIRPRSLEPFDFEHANMSGELWLAEGFTEYYAQLVLGRTGLADRAGTAAQMAGFINSVAANPAHLVRSAEENSRMAPFTDAGHPADQTNWPNTVISYYRYGGAIALALDLTLRERGDGGVTLDDYMRAMWRTYGKPGGSREGYVDRPYTMADAEAQLAAVSGDAGFARDFFRRYIEGHDVADYARLLQPAGFAVRRRGPGLAWWGDVGLAPQGGASIATPPAFDTPLYLAGVDVGDRLLQVDGRPIGTPEDVGTVLRRRKPGDRIALEVADRRGATRTTTVTLAEDPKIELVPVEAIGSPLTAAQRAFRERWLDARPN